MYDREKLKSLSQKRKAQEERSENSERPGPFVTTSGRQEEMAFASGFSGQRATQTWVKRIDILAEQGFIMLAEGPAGPRTYILILNPYAVIKRLKKDSSIDIPNATYNALLQRTTEIGATDLNT